MKNKILIIDDDAIITEVLKLQLEDFNFNIVTENNSNLALTTIDNNPDIDLILLDIAMPGIDGISLLKNIRQKFSAEVLPIIMLTAHSINKNIKETLKLGANDYIQKPTKTNVLIARIEEQLKNKKRTETKNTQNLYLKKLNVNLEKLLDSSIELMEFMKATNKIHLEDIIIAADNLCPKFFNADYFAIFLLKKNSGLEIKSKNKNDCYLENFNKFIFDQNNIMFDTIKKQKMIAIKNFFQSKYYTENCIKSYSNTEKTGIICLPLKFEKKILGVFYIRNISEEYFKPSNLFIFGLVANHLSLALNNALLYKKVKNASLTDALTQLNNRHYIFQYFPKLVITCQRYNRNLSILMLDIDHFKKVNDTFGHDHGDIVLRKIAEILNISLRTSDIPCRYGGEEFIVILPETDSEKAFKLAERIRKKIENTIIIINGNKINTSVSIGLSELKKNEKFDELIKRADIALYNAKNNGRNQTKIAD